MPSRKAKAKHHARRAERIEVRVGKALARFAEQPVVKRVCSLGELADQPQLVALSAGTFGVGVVLGDDRLARTGLRMIAAHALATFAKGVIKHHVDRRRPHAGGDHRMKPGRIVDEPHHNSFPSGHSAGAVAVARAVARDYPKMAAPGGAVAGFAMLAQLPAAKHFPLDVAVGAAIGIAAELVVTGVTGTDPRRHRTPEVGA